PLYYIGLNFLCSFFPGSHSKWIGLFMNLVLFVLSQSAMFFLTFRFIKNKWLRFLPIITYGFSLAAVNTVLFIRMYMLMSFEGLLLLSFITLLHDNVLNTLNGKTYSKKILAIPYAGLFITMMAGLLTQYYFVIFAFFVCAVMGIWLLAKKQIKRAFLFAVSVFAGMCGAYVLFPEMRIHIFEGYRGDEAVDNLFSGEGLAIRLGNMFENINTQMYSRFGYVILGIVLFSLIVSVVYKIAKKEKKDYAFGIILVLAGLVGYFFIVTKISPYSHFRYVAIIFPSVALVVGIIVDSFTFSKPTKIYALILSVVMIAATCASSIITQPEFLYKGYNEVISRVDADENPKCFYIKSDDSAYAVIEFEDLFGHMDGTYIIKTEELEDHIDVINETLAENGEAYLILDGTAKRLKCKDKILKLTNADSVDILFGYKSMSIMGSRGSLYKITAKA
ncbi:MAG: hypothetical protein Q4C42_09530, partial [Clostridia bacterium]|nr:hypothetical protein [Clostridia bacterium]